MLLLDSITGPVDEEPESRSSARAPVHRSADTFSIIASDSGVDTGRASSSSQRRRSTSICVDVVSAIDCTARWMREHSTARVVAAVAAAVVLETPEEATMSSSDDDADLFADTESEGGPERKSLRTDTTPSDNDGLKSRDLSDKATAAAVAAFRSASVAAVILGDVATVEDDDDDDEVEEPFPPDEATTPH